MSEERKTNQGGEMREFYVDRKYGPTSFSVKSTHGWRYSVQAHDGEWIIRNDSGWLVFGERAQMILRAALAY